MAARILTEITLRKLTPPSRGQVEVWDSKLPGFGIRIAHTGTKSFVLVYRIAGRPRRLTIGRYPILGLADARLAAQKALTQIAQGIDPREAKLKQQEQVQIRTSKLFGTLINTFIETHCRRHNRPNTAKETERLLRVDFFPHWRNKSVVDINKSDVAHRLDEIVAKGSPSAANHAYAAIRKFFNWCVERGHISVSPCLGMSAPSRHQSRDRVLQDDELANVWTKAATMGWPFAPIVHLLILTAQRRGEVSGMRWQDLDLEAGVWTKPADLTKNGRAHTIPLTPFMIGVISTLPRMSDTYAFPARGETGTSYGGFNKAKAKLDQMVAIENWTLHDLRRTAATGMAKLGVPPHVVERLLNHTSGTLGGVAGVYNRFEYQDEMRDALQKWESAIVQNSRTRGSLRPISKAASE